MSATTMAVENGGMPRIEASPGPAVRVRPLTALKPSLQELYRADPIAVRQEVERRARIARAVEMRAFFARLFEYLRKESGK